MTDTNIATDDPSPAPTTPRPVRNGQTKNSTQLISVLALVVPVALVAYRNALVQQSGVTLRELFLAPLVGGSALLFWILFLHLVVCADGLDVFGFRKPRLGLDLLIGVALSVALFAIQFAFSATLARFFPPRPAVRQILELIAGVSRNPLLLALWLGPVAWIGVALFEEVARAFLLRRFWLVWPGTTAKWIAILIVSCLVGLVHAYQGTGAIACVGIQSILLGWVFLRTGRIRSLIVAHALYDSAQIVMAVVTIRQMGF